MDGLREAQQFLELASARSGISADDHRYREEQLRSAEQHLVHARGCCERADAAKDKDVLWDHYLHVLHIGICISYLRASGGGSNQRAGWEAAMVGINALFAAFTERFKWASHKTFHKDSTMRNVRTDFETVGGRMWPWLGALQPPPAGLQHGRVGRRLSGVQRLAPGATDVATPGGRCGRLTKLRGP